MRPVRERWSKDVNLYVDEIKTSNSFRLGVLWLKSREVVRVWQDWLEPYFSVYGLKFHRHEDFQSNPSKADQLPWTIHGSLSSADDEEPSVVFKVFDGRDEYQAWRSFYNWIEDTLVPTVSRPAFVFHDTYDFSKKAGGAHVFLSGKDASVIPRRSVPKIKPNMAKPERNAFLIGCVDYLLCSEKFKTKDRRQKK
jgi:hypothetical protein